MPKISTDRVVESLPWLDSVASVLAKALAPILGPEGDARVKDALYGTWLGHPLHPALVSMPIGFWTSTAVLDLCGREAEADLTLQLGLLSALGAAASGAAQWQDTQDMVKPRRLGALHATLNLAAVAVYGTSWWLRAQGSRKAGVAVAMAGLSMVNVSGWLGGDLAYVLGLGVNRAAFEPPLTDWVDVLADAEIEEGGKARIEANGVPILLSRREGKVWAIAATCTHLGGPLADGTVEGDTVTCPWHGSTFDLRDGSVVHGPATIPQTCFRVQVRNGRIAVRSEA
ncbi:MAG TPA: Rieske 2Fe-2S domain-containing protein [Chloroflexota bacterium]|nr:Rieske 2Fe-2S domain-containing protein [Chloroflexota bacterium]